MYTVAKVVADTVYAQIKALRARPACVGSSKFVTLVAQWVHVSGRREPERLRSAHRSGPALIAAAPDPCTTHHSHSQARFTTKRRARARH